MSKVWPFAALNRNQSSSPGFERMPLSATGSGRSVLVAWARSSLGSASRTFGKSETRTQLGDGGYCPSTPRTSEEFARQHARMFGTRPIRREAGPWRYADTDELVFPPSADPETESEDV